jgi:hypothetical protein
LRQIVANGHVICRHVIIGHWCLDTLCDNLYVDNDVFLDKLLWMCWVQIVTCGQPPYRTNIFVCI